MAQTLLVALSLGGALALAFQITTWPDHPLADMTHVTHWVRNIGSGGVLAAYAGTYPETYMIYPPAMAYVYAAAHTLAATIPPPLGVRPDDWLRVCIKLMPVAGHGLLALALFAGVTMAGGFWRGWTALTLYAWNPGALFDAAYWGQGDSLNVALLALALAIVFAVPAWWPLIAATRPRVWPQLGALLAGVTAGALIGTAGLTKPQTWVFLPLVVWLLLRRLGPHGLLAAGGAGAATAWRIVEPWRTAGRMDELLSVFTNVTQVMPSVSANAHNLWWLKLPGVALSVFDTVPVGGFGDWVAPPLVSHATLGRLGFALVALLPLLRLTGPLSYRLVAACAAYTSAAYFMTITQVHENHMFAALPFLAAAAALDGWFVAPFLIATACVFLNMALHDFLIGDALAAWLAERLPWKDALAIQTANARLNVAGFALFTLVLLRRPPVGAQSPRLLLWRARLALAAGAVVAGGALTVAYALVTVPERAAAVWERLAERAAQSGPVEAHLGRKTPVGVLLERAALEYANALYLFAGLAVVVGAVAALAGVWWLAVARTARSSRARHLRTVEAAA
ncbi:MAG TPA: hypothetical protein VFX49_16870 [Chloroflexota bacterium]|nr:hypothetical protein [Chloroflexota bacterium]